MIHGDYAVRNVLFDHDAVVGILDFDNCQTTSRGRDVLRCISHSFHATSPHVTAFFEGYAEGSGISSAEVTEYFDFWRYTCASRVWPIADRYLSPHTYQARWDSFITEDLDWFESDWSRARETLLAIARKSGVMLPETSQGDSVGPPD